MIRSIIKLLFFASLVLLGVASWRSDELPPANVLDAALLDEPVQRAVRERAFDVESHGITYSVQPLYSYELVGLVVSKHDANTWWDYLHREWKDSLNVVDLCVIWGNNARSGAYVDIAFSSGQFTCNFSTSSNEAFAAFDPTAISNNHLLTNDPRLARALLSVRVGDQIRFRGRLAEYSHNAGFAFRRGTSTVRTDTGNGACETVYVDDMEILKAGNRVWRMLVWVGVVLLVFSVLAWFFQPVRFDD